MQESIGNSHVLHFGVFEVDTRARELRKQGLRVRLQEQPFQILRLLLERAGDVVTREELRQQLWPSSVYVDFDHGLNNAVARLREVLGDEAGNPRFIETLPRLGYRFIYPVESTRPTSRPVNNEAAVISETQSVAPAVPTDAAPRRDTRPLAVISAIVFLAALGVLAVVWLARRPGEDTRTASLPHGPSIAVLPFVNLSAEEENEFFSDGLTEELVTKLAGIRGLRVVARTSSFQFKGKQESAGAIAHALQVDHFLEGSVRRSGPRLRITAQLIDAQRDEHVWAQTFDREVGDIFQIQEEIAFAVATALKVSLIEPDKVRIRTHGTGDPEAYRLYLIAHAHLVGRTRAPDLNVAKRSLEAAIARDPDFAAAHAGLARYYQAVWSRLRDPEEGVRLGVAAAERAVALDPGSSEALQERGNFHFWRYRYRGDYGAYIAAQADLQRAIELDPSNSLAFEDLGWAMLWHAPDEASSLLERAIQLDLLCTGPNILIAVIQGSRGHLQAARERCADLLRRAPDAKECSMSVAALETYFGHFEQAVPHLRALEKSIGGAARNQLWAVHMSMGDRAGAQKWLDFGKAPYQKALVEAARHAMEGRHEQAFAVLELHRAEHPQDHRLDLPSAKFALLAGQPQRALEILEQRVPDLVRGIEPISARNVLPALDLATAQLGTGARDQASALLERIAAHLDGPGALRLPMFAFQRARGHALAGETDAALRALDRAYDEGLRTTWALDLRPQHLLYIDPIEADPAFLGLRDDPRFKRWLERIKADNARQLEALTVRDAARPAG